MYDSVCFALYDKTGHYSKFTGTTMLSLFENTASHVTIHILHDNTLSIDNRDKFIYLAGQYGQIVKFYNVEELCTDKINEIKKLVPNVSESRYSIATFYRFLIPQVFSTDIQKIIYLDSDTIVNLDINELWQIKLNDKPLAAPPEVEIDYLYHPINAPKKYLIANNFVDYNDYFNAGVLLMNLEHLRQNDDLLTIGLQFLNSHEELEYFDQDILNYLFSKNYIKINEKFDVFIGMERKTPSRNHITRSAIYHYTGSSLKLDLFNDVFDRLWMSYFIKTPWFDVDTMGRFYAGVQQLHIGLKQSMANVSAMMSGKTRAFFVVPESIDAIKKIFSIRDDEEIILAKNQSSIKKLLAAMKDSRSKKVFFILVNGFQLGVLIQAGFEYGRDFVNGFEFLSEAQGVSLNSHPLIKAM